MCLNAKGWASGRLGSKTAATPSLISLLRCKLPLTRLSFSWFFSSCPWISALHPPLADLHGLISLLFSSLSLLSSLPLSYPSLHSSPPSSDAFSLTPSLVSRPAPNFAIGYLYREKKN
ncbi:hypothetical protein BJX70DRAFT_92138 [Aspergillus crustosus]